MADRIDLRERLRVKPGSRVRLSQMDPAATHGWDKATAGPELARQLGRLADLQDRFWAAADRSVLVVLQGIDAAGKDGTINKVMEAFNPQGCPVTSFKVPSAEELAHDFLWRVHKAAPRKGEIGIFNRSHYEDVLVVRVHGLVPEAIWSARYDQINDFERML
ncbi:MAG: polyphosphate kinase 2 family protein, partial [Chloroflexota bacterium]|nr:polyphosphate kinase 2 family protein [Chloroflexota bacterium]